MNESLLISVSAPINRTGGSVTLQSTVSAYEHFTDGEANLSISMNYYRISVSQPMNFYSENKWSKKLLMHLNRQKEIEVKDTYSDEILECMRSYFDIIICQQKDSLLQSELAFYELLIQRMNDELSVGRTLETEIEEVRIKCEELMLHIRDNENERKRRRDFIMMKYGLVVDDFTIWICPRFPILELNIEQLELKAMTKFEAQSAYAIEEHKKNIEKLKRSRWGTPSFTANMGLSSSSTDFYDLKNHMGKDYGAGMSFSMSITGFSNNKKELKKAIFQNESLQMSNREKREKLLCDLRSDCQHYNHLYGEYYINISRERLLSKKLDIVVAKLKVQHILFDEVEEVMSKIFQVRLSQIENIRDSYLLISNINKKTSY